MFLTENLLRNEFFPSELPPCFDTIDLSNNASGIINTAKAFGRNFSAPLTYSGYKSESSRRKFAIPNPYHYCKAVNLLVENKTEVAKIFKKSKYSLTAPTQSTPNEKQAFSKRSNKVSETKKEIEKLYQDNRYEIRLDINAFFDNIYTHSISWAIHGQSTAKAKKDDKTLLGNKIDTHIRALNNNQTNGILVGNALSRIVSEIILCTVDHQIQQKFKDINCCRFVDDYFIYTKNSSQIQQIISYIRTCLASYELYFNENKIQINESPFLYEKPWIEQIKQFIHLQPDVFLSKLIMEYINHKDIAILKYGIKILAHTTFTEKEWPTIQSRIINLLVRFPSLADRILPLFWQNKSHLKTNTIKKALYSIIDENLILNRDQEVIWACWYAKIFDITISQAYICKILESTNDIAKIIILDLIYKNKKQNAPKIKQRLNTLYTDLSAKDTDDSGHTNVLLWTSHWLLAYEATKNKWLNIDGKVFDFARKNQFFSYLLSNNIQFYKPNFSYAEPNNTTSRFEYATRYELYKAIKKLKDAIEFNKKFGMLQLFSEDETDLVDKVVEALENDENSYIG